VEVPEWSGDMTDMVLPKVHDYLNFLAGHSNVSAALRSNPFQAPPQSASFNSILDRKYETEQ